VNEDDVKPTAWTLHFKQGKYTVLLFSEPLTPLSTLKTELLTILRERYTSGLPRSGLSEPLKIPDSIDEVALGVPIDVYEPSKGWVELGAGGKVKQTPKSLGLKDGSVVAFTFVPAEREDETVEFNVEWSSYDEQYADDMMDKE
jgi:hypothetical protein